MKDFQDEYKKSVEKSYIPEELINITKQNLFKNHKKQMRHISVKMLLISAALITCMCVSVFAYELYYKPINKNAGTNHIFTDGQASNEQNVNNTSIVDNIKINLKSIIADSTNLYMTIELSTIDGSALMPSTEYSIADIKGEFSKKSIVYDNKNYEIADSVRTDDCSKLSYAVYELQYSSLFNSKTVKESVDTSFFKDKDLKLDLSDFKFTKTNLKNIYSKYKDIKELYNDAMVATDSDYSIIGLPDQVHNASGIIDINNYILNSGSNHIKFSDIFPDSYIDNIGIHSNDLLGDALYISIVPGNNVDLESLENLCLLDTVTGKLIKSSIYKKSSMSSSTSPIYIYQDGRLNLSFFDSDNYNISSDLSRYKLVLFESTKTSTIAGNWTIDFRIENINDSYVYTPTTLVKITDNDSIDITSIKLSNSNIQVIGKAKFSTESNLAKIYNLINIKVTLQDGTVLPFSGNGFTQHMGENYYMSCNLKSLINADKVVGIELYGQYISLK